MFLSNMTSTITSVADFFNLSSMLKNSVEVHVNENDASLKRNQFSLSNSLGRENESSWSNT